MMEIKEGKALPFRGTRAPRSETGRVAFRMKPGDIVEGLTLAERDRLSVALYRLRGPGSYASGQMEGGTYAVWIPKEETHE